MALLWMSLHLEPYLETESVFVTTQRINLFEMFGCKSMALGFCVRTLHMLFLSFLKS